MEPNRMIAAYVRSSYDDDGIVFNQIELIIRTLFAGEAQKSCALKLYVDLGFSGQDASRPGYQQLLHDMNEGMVSELIVAGMSRLSRNESLFEEIIHIAQENDVELVSII